MKNKIYLIMLLFQITILQSCDKFLAEKQASSISTVDQVSHLQLLLDNISDVNQSFASILEYGVDDFFVDEKVLSARPAFDQSVYIWEDPEFILVNENQQWSSPYKPIMVANVVLEALERIKEGDEQTRNHLRGSALFIRSLSYYYLSQIYAVPYSADNQKSQYGLVIRPSSDINGASVRYNLGDSYSYMLTDLMEAVELLPAEAWQKTRPSKKAALALLARIYLVMGEYENALDVSTKLLDISHSLLDLNHLNIGSAFPFQSMNTETLYFCYSTSALLLAQSRANISKELYNSYHADDLRKQAYFYQKSNGNIGFKGSYTGTTSPLFLGMVLDEVYLIRAECLVRLGKNHEARQCLSTLMKTRWKDGSYQLDEDIPGNDLLKVILAERRKQLVFRGVRWSDLRRLNMEPRHQTFLKRTIVLNNGKTDEYTLVPKSPRYTYLLPEKVVEITRVLQNVR